MIIYTCMYCGKIAERQFDCGFVRTCAHKDSPIVASVSATVRGDSNIGMKDAVPQPTPAN